MRNLRGRVRDIILFNQKKITSNKSIKPFDLEKAKRGDSVCLEDGTAVKILDFDLNGNIVCKYKRNEEYEDLHILEGTNGKGYIEKNGKSELIQILFMAPKYAYMNIYRDPLKKTAYGSILYRTDEERFSHINDGGEVFLCAAKVELYEFQETGETKITEDQFYKRYLNQ